MKDILSIILSYLPTMDVLNYRVTSNYNNNYVCNKLSKKYIIKIKSDNVNNIRLLNNEDGINNLYYDLNLSHNISISDERVKSLTNLISLNLYDNDIVSDESIKCLINLTKLNLCGNDKISDEIV